LDPRGFPVPWIVAWIDGVPDFRIIEPEKMQRACDEHRCWICGEVLGRYLTSVIGPMCAINRTIAEPPSHLDCAQYAAQACPFLARPHMVRRDGHLPDTVVEAAGVGLKRNPGVCCLWTSRRVRPFAVPGGGVLFALGEPTSIAWYCEGRDAIRAEVLAAIESGLPILEAMAREEGPVATRALHAMTQRALVLVPLEKVPPP
jgi:hypothetical protein